MATSDVICGRYNHTATGYQDIVWCGLRNPAALESNMYMVRSLHHFSSGIYKENERSVSQEKSRSRAGGVQQIQGMEGCAPISPVLSCWNV